ncbi:MAG TPA: hypothetical protein DCQ52_16230, partial [Acidimicrobiaceae bacterium]|nr:hypothetical protein [Acidimicrobiaceae bacterium]
PQPQLGSVDLCAELGGDGRPGLEPWFGEAPATGGADALEEEAHERMIWTHPGMSTYYRNPRGRVVTVMPWTLVDYWSLTHDVDVAAYT